MILRSIPHPDGGAILDIPSARDLRVAFDIYFDSKYPQRTNLTKEKLWNALNDYVQFCIDYFTSELAGRTPSPDDVAPFLFVVDFENLQQYQNFLKVAIYAAKEYAVGLQRRLSRTELDIYKELIFTILSDFENLIIDYEHYIKKENKEAHATIGSRNRHLITDGKWAAQSMVFIEHELSSKKPDFRGIRPYSLFIDRQCLEIAGNNLLGFDRIMDKSGNSIHKFTQVGWKFLEERSHVTDDVKGWSISLPYEIETIRALVNWSNSFVHQMKFYTSYIQHYAMVMMWDILQPAQGDVKTALGRSWSVEKGRFYIDNYRNLKRDFEHYVKVENGNKSATIVWKPLHHVGAYLNSLGPGKVLYAMHMPPPVHGASMVGKYIKDSILLKSRFEGEYINLTTAENLNDIGQFGIKKILNYIKMLVGIRKAIKKGKPDVIYLTPNAAGNAFYKDFVTVCLIKHWAGYSLFDFKWPVKIVWNCKSKKEKRKEDRKANILVHYHNKGVKEFSKREFNDKLYKMFFKDLYVLLLGEVLYEDVRKYVPVSKVEFCGNGLPELSKEDNEKISDVVKVKYEDKTNRPLHIIFLSNMMADKGVWTLVDACKILKDKGVSFKCTFVGGWKDITEVVFNQKIISLGLQAEVKAVGAVYGAEKEPYWLDADVFVFPTYYHNECFPLVLLEAMQHAIPCISTKEGAIPNIIDDGETGFVVNAKNPGYLAVKIEELANDKQKRLDMGVNGYRKYNDQFTLKVFENRMCDVLEQLI